MFSLLDQSKQIKVTAMSVQVTPTCTYVIVMVLKEVCTYVFALLCTLVQN